MTSSRLSQSQSPGSNQSHQTFGSSMAYIVSKSPSCQAVNPFRASCSVFLAHMATVGPGIDGRQRWPATPDGRRLPERCSHPGCSRSALGLGFRSPPIAGPRTPWGFEFRANGPCPRKQPHPDTESVASTGPRYIVALADDADRVRLTEGILLIDELPGVVLAEAEASVARRLAEVGEYVGVYTNITDAHRAFSLFVPES